MSIPCRIILLASVVSAIGHRILAAQTDSAAAPTVGARVRVRGVVGGSEGIVSFWSPDSVAITTGSAERGWNLHQTGLSLDLSTGRKGALLHGLGIGFLAGAVGGATLGLAAGGGCDNYSWICFDRGTLAAGLGALFAVVGGVAGGVVGGLSHRTIWRPLNPAEAHVAVRVMPTLSRSGVQLTGSISF